MFYIKLYINDYKIQCVRKKVFPSRKAPFCLCTFFAGFIGNREKKTTVFNQPLTLRLLKSYIYGTPILDVSISHTTTQQSR